MARRGWEVRVIAARPMYQDVLDHSLCEGLEDVRVDRTHALDVRAWLRRLRGPAAPPDAAPAATTSGGRASTLGRVRAALGWLVRLVEIPDPRAGWMPFAFAAGARGGRPSLVLATMPSFSNALVGAALAAWHRAPLVLDYRDPWPRDSSLPRPRRALEARLERACLRRAVRVVATTPGIARELASASGRGVEVVTNACEPERFEDIAPRAFERPTLVYAGGLYGDRTLTPVLDALAALRDAGRLDPERLQLLYMGRTADVAAAQTAARGLEDFVEIEGVRPNRDSLAATLGAACNLTIVGAGHVRQIPAKIFEHLAARRPMLVVAPPGSDTESLLAPIPWARCVGDDDRGAIEQALLQVASGALADATGEIPEALTVEATMDALHRLLVEAAGAERDTATEGGVA
jgi:glycosyltransferase involved in cell wall biosynthesis